MALRETFNYNIVCRQCKVRKKTGQAPLELVININGDRKFIQLPRREEPKVFEKAMASLKPSDIKSFCDSIRKKVDAIVTNMQEQGIALTTNNLVSEYKNDGVNVFTISMLFDDYLKILKKRVDVDLTIRTYQKYQRTKLLFFQSNGLKGDEPARKINRQHVDICSIHLKTIYDNNTTAGYLQKLKTFFNYAFQCGKITNTPMAGMKFHKEENEKNIKYLTQEEVNRIREHKFLTKRLEDVADVFLFSCFTGLAYCDVKALEPDDFQKKGDVVYINKDRKKTGVNFYTILLSDAQRIAEKYNYQLPTKSNDKTNEALKEIAALCNIDKNLTFHMARHTCAVYLINHRNPTIEKETIMKVCGWKTEKQYRHYAKLLSNTLIEDLSPIKDEYVVKEEPPFKIGKNRLNFDFIDE